MHYRWLTYRDSEMLQNAQIPQCFVSWAVLQPLNTRRCMKSYVSVVRKLLAEDLELPSEGFGSDV